MEGKFCGLQWEIEPSPRQIYEKSPLKHLFYNSMYQKQT